MASFAGEDEEEEEEVPEELEAGEQVFDLCFHPTADVLACGLVTGSVELWRYGVGAGANSLLMKVKHSSSSSCRGVQFSPDGTLLYTAGSDRRLRVFDSSGAKVKTYEEAHSDSINRMLLLSEHLLATGDDSGEVKVWDTRTDEGQVLSWHVHEDFVSGLAVSESRPGALLSCSGDATLGVYDLRAPATTARSDDQEAELQCLTVIKNGHKVLAGTPEGVVLVFTWDRWGDCSDRYPGHPESIDCLHKLDESTVLTGSSDGLIRCVAVQPNKMLGIIGDHDEFPVEQMRADRSGRLLGTASHDSLVRFWDLSMFADDEDDDDEGGEGQGQGEGEGEGAMADGAEGEGEGEGEEDEEGEDAEMDEEEGGDSTPFDSGSDDSDDDSDSDSGGAAGGGRPRLKTAAEKFYSGL